MDLTENKIKGLLSERHPVESWKITIPFYLSLSFFAGAIVSSILVMKIHAQWLLAAGCFYTLAGIFTVIFKRFYAVKKRNI